MTTPSEERKRGGCLTAFLILMAIANPLTGLYYLFAGSAVQQALPTILSWVIPVLGLLALANFAFALGMWNWKRWGVYGFVASTAIVFLLNAITISVLAALLGLIGVAILILLVRPIWSEME
jgi:hypothetical protein